MTPADYISINWHILPLRYRSKVPLPDLTPRGFLDARTDAQPWQRWPNLGVGIAVEASQLLVIDIDPRNGGDETWGALSANKQMPPTPEQLTGGGGRHIVFRRPTGWFRASLGPGIDVKSSGYIVAAPSIHPSGTVYQWDVGAHPLDTPLADPPPWLLHAAQRPAPNPVELTGPAAQSFMGRVFARAGLAVRVIDERRMSVVCPLRSYHTTDGPAGTVILAPTAVSPLGAFHCSHSSHGRLSTQDALALIDRSVLDQVVAEMRAAQPPRSNP